MQNTMNSGAWIRWHENGQEKHAHIPALDRILLSGKISSMVQPDPLLFSATSSDGQLSISRFKSIKVHPQLYKKRLFVSVTKGLFHFGNLSTIINCVRGAIK